IIDGYSDHTFRPNEQVLRAQVTKMIANARLTHTHVSPTTFNYDIHNIAYGWPVGSPHIPSGRVNAYQSPAGSGSYATELNDFELDTDAQSYMQTYLDNCAGCAEIVLLKYPCNNGGWTNLSTTLVAGTFNLDALPNCIEDLQIKTYDKW